MFDRPRASRAIDANKIAITTRELLVASSLLVNSYHDLQLSRRNFLSLCCSLDSASIDSRYTRAETLGFQRHFVALINERRSITIILFYSSRVIASNSHSFVPMDLYFYFLREKCTEEFFVQVFFFFFFTIE